MKQALLGLALLLCIGAGASAQDFHHDRDFRDHRYYRHDHDRGYNRGYYDRDYHHGYYQRRHWDHDHDMYRGGDRRYYH